MSNTKYDDLSILNSSRRDWKIRVKVVRFWRGATKLGQPFNNFNVVLIDKQETKIQAFIPAKCNETLQDKLALGTVCSITNFDVELYKSEDKFRPVQNEHRLVFAEDTKVKLLDEKQTKLPDDTFDFYDHDDLLTIANQNVYLTDVVGIIQNKESLKLNEVVNRLNQQQTQFKFTITDGSSKVKVTLWDNMAKKVYEELQKPLDEPVIIILAAAKVGKWKEEVDLSHVAATHFYLNHNHHTVNKIRRMLQDPVFSQSLDSSQKVKKPKLLTTKELKQLGMDSVKTAVINQVVVKYVDDKDTWFLKVCTKCKQTVGTEGENYTCKICNRIIPYPEKRYKINIVGADKTGAIEIVLHDRQVRTLIGKRAQVLFDEQKQSIAFPGCLKELQSKEITVQFTIEEVNIVTKDAPYVATKICSGFQSITPENEKESSVTANNTQKQCSTSTYHLDGISQLNVDSES